MVKVVPELEIEFDVRWATRGQTAYFSESAPGGDGLLKPTAGRVYEVTHEPENIKEVGLSRGVRAEYIDRLTELSLCLREITPVSNSDAGNVHALFGILAVRRKYVFLSVSWHVNTKNDCAAD